LPKADPAKKQWSGDAKVLPRSALHFRSECKFADVAAGDEGKTVPFTMTARTADPINHWYWGRVVHDMNGMELSKPKLAVDYCHDADEVMGFADKFDLSSGDLVVSGELIPMPDDEDDCATEVIYKQKLGVPYEASIDFSGGNPVIEWVPAGATVEVNAKEFAGPGYVIRQWTLRGLAICPYGADPNTTTEFAASDKITVTTINAPKGEQQMSQPNQATTDPTKGAAAGAGANPAQLQQQGDGGATPPPAAGGEPKPEQKYITAFGDVGARWFLEKKPIEECVTEFTKQLKVSHSAELEQKQKQFDQDKAALQGQLDAANQKLASIGRGDGGVTFSNADGGNADPNAVKANQHLSPGMARFAQAIKLPGQKK
jgi:hypothetical protein